MNTRRIENLTDTKHEKHEGHRLEREGFHAAADRIWRGGEWRVTDRLGRWFVSESKPREAC